MAAGTWKIYSKAKRYIGAGGVAMTSGGVTLGAGVFKMCLLKASASAAIKSVAIGGISTWASISSFEIAAQGGYAAHGRNIDAAGGGAGAGTGATKWTTGASTKQLKFTYTTTGLVFTASGANLSVIKYAVIRTSSGANAGKVLCFCTLSTSPFSITTNNTLTILPAATGVFTLA
jgi:hypothetical protein